MLYQLDSPSGRTRATDPHRCTTCEKEVHMMTKKMDSGKPRDVSDPTDFLDTYCRERGIERNVENALIADCVRRAEEARENFKRMRVSGAPEPFSRGQKWRPARCPTRKSTADGC